jgi:phosphatidylserine/phosphatidylglycerophosphate/cardiolipin synthase-like enzyme
VVPSGSDLVWSPGAQTPLVDLIDSARSGTTIWAEDEQLDSQPIQQALVSAAKRGVTVNDDTAYEGSANFTTAMTDQNRNVGIITNDPGMVRGIRSTIASDFAGAAPFAPGHSTLDERPK